jgi:hypothetical protein
MPSSSDKSSLNSWSSLSQESSPASSDHRHHACKPESQQEARKQSRRHACFFFRAFARRIAYWNRRVVMDEEEEKEFLRRLEKSEQKLAEAVGKEARRLVDSARRSAARPSLSTGVSAVVVGDLLSPLSCVSLPLTLLKASSIGCPASPVDAHTKARLCGGCFIHDLRVFSLLTRSPLLLYRRFDRCPCRPRHRK